ncbi:MAG: helix-turn-helix domain-containing protein [Anaerolineales bacterium]|nr:helix-turn-helix domain-containing protein [Anaerolineales bacterium]
MRDFSPTLTRKAITMPDCDQFMTVSNAAKSLKFHPETVRRRVRDGILAGQKWGKAWLVLKSSVEDYIKILEGRKTVSCTKRALIQRGLFLHGFFGQNKKTPQFQGVFSWGARIRTSNLTSRA